MEKYNANYYYKTLGLTPGTSAKEIKKAYRQLVKLWHPDNFPAQPQQQLEAEEKIKKINEAYEYLKNYKPANFEPKASIRTETVKSKIDPEPFYRNGVNYAQIRRYKQAIEELTKAILIDPDYLDAYLYRGFIYEKLGQNIRAEKDFNKATKLKLRQTSQTYQPAPEPTPTPEPTANFNGPWRCAGTLQGHTDTISSIALSPDGRMVVTGSYDRTVIVWQLSTGRILHLLGGHTGRVYGVDVSPDGKLVASGSGDKTVKLWKLSNGSLLRTLGGWFGGHAQSVLTVAFSPNKRTLVSGSSDRSVKVWQVSSGKELRTLTGYSSAVRAIAVSPDGKLFASGGTDGALRIREMNGRLIRSNRVTFKILSLAYRPDNRHIAVGGEDGILQLWDGEGTAEICTLKHDNSAVYSLVFSPDSQTLVSGANDGSLKFWDAATYQEQFTLKAHRDRIDAIAFSPDGQTFVSGGVDKLLKVWWQREG
jgi:WD40 repeat protein